MAHGLNRQDDTKANGMARLAEKLVRRLGVEEAQRVCRDNSWYGILRFIQGHMNNSAHI